ncbi:hypothetical protein [Hoeflea olei]|uniref:Uncharacterized protein n=1 Tax=Hoeflea olei TaxID=1480615 RepID=A0A1C1YRL4_9HYPH|nr:hypothetical protein [Hoeflea olei]OCW56155.1 hypothetical protein AWJ14_18820 [Hoeflea olei]
MNKILVALGLTLAASTGALADSGALDAYTAPNANLALTVPATGVTNTQVSYARAGNDGSPSFSAPQGNIDYTATASIGAASGDQAIYHRADNDGSPTFR